jgi:hypothetical protein
MAGARRVRCKISHQGTVDGQHKFQIEDITIEEQKRDHAASEY